MESSDRERLVENNPIPPSQAYPNPSNQPYPPNYPALNPALNPHQNYPPNQYPPSGGYPPQPGGYPIPQGYSSVPPSYPGGPQGYSGAPQGYSGPPQGYPGPVQNYPPQNQQPRYVVAPVGPAIGNEVMVGAPGMLLLGDMATEVVCPQCRQTVLTNVQKKAGNTAWIICIVLCFCCFPFCIYPLICDPCLDTYHICPSCQQIIAIKTPS